MEAVTRTFEVQAEQKGLRLFCELPSIESPILMGDPGRTRQILVNLVGNAIKFTVEGEIRLAVSEESRGEDGAVLHFTVRDTGIGIPDNKLDTIFQSFPHARSDATRRYEGTGLGLAISSRLVQMAGGKIWAESKLGVGSAFHCNIPFGIPPGEPHPENAHRKVVSSLPLPVQPESPSPVHHILVAEDNPINQKLTVRLLEKKGYSTAVAENGLEALALLGKYRFDMILMDVQMPDMGGLETTRVIREREHASGGHIPIVAVTANVMKGDREECLGSGMDDYVSKPILPEEMFRVMESHLGVIHT
jgi:CheY-like chemotaxis protein